jgi:hypothetical protein
MFNHLPTLSSLDNLVREAAKRTLGTTPTNRKLPFQWRDVSAFASVYAPLDCDSPYYHLVVAVLCVITFGAMCRFDDAANMVQSDTKFGQHANLVVFLRKRKSDLYRQSTFCSHSV